MSDKLREIIAAQKQDENPFFKDAEGRIIEITASKGEVFTGYYQADNDVFYTEKDWLEQQRQKELARLAEEEYQEQQKLLAAERAERERKREQLAAQQKAEDATDQKHNKNSKIKNLIIIISVVGVTAASILFWPSSPDIKENTTPDVIITDTIVSDTDTQRFGDAIVTGSDVRMRAEPNLKGKIITYFPKEGERVQLIQVASDSLNWAQVRRENGTTGWVFGDFIKKE